MTNLFKKLNSISVLNDAWRSVRQKAIRSASGSIRNEAELFDENSPRNIRSIQDRLRNGRYSFRPQTGVAQRREGKSPRPIVVAPLENKIVQRAMLDVLNAHVPEIAALADVPTSFGGVRNKSVSNAIALVREAADRGMTFYIRSDIPSFFSRINKVRVYDLLAGCISDQRFLDLIKSAIRTELENEAELTRRGVSKIFPLGNEGVSQGSSLSPMLANLYLKEFDKEMNLDSEFLCIRYIDDFVILGGSERAVSRGFKRAQAILKRLGLEVYSPDDNPEKASRGALRKGLDFLGCTITDDSVVPSRAACKKLLESIEAEERRALHELRLILRGGTAGKAGCYAQALANINKIVWGWGKAFSFCGSSHVLKTLDGEISRRVKAFNIRMQAEMSEQSGRNTRLILGVRMLTDAVDDEEH